MKHVLLILAIKITLLNLLNAQNTGIGTTTPAQVLDVNGKIQVANDLAPATKGAIRFDNSTNEHQGYDGTEWKSFTTGNSGFPSNAQPIYGYVTVPRDNQDYIRLKIQSSGVEISQVPAGKFVIITSYQVQLNGSLTLVTQPSGRTIGGLGPNNSNIGFPIVDRLMKYNFNGEEPVTRESGGGAPLFVVRGGEYLQAYNSSSTFSSYTVEFRVQGFLVDDLNY